MQECYNELCNRVFVRLCVTFLTYYQNIQSDEEESSRMGLL
jgi:hypothetical protein